MRKSLLIVAVFVATLTPSAHADVTDYTIDFTESSGTDAVPTGTIVYDSSGPSLSLTVAWDGFSFMFTGLELEGGFQAPPPSGCTAASYDQLLINELGGCAGPMNWMAATTGTGNASIDFENYYFEGGGYSAPIMTTPPATEDSGIVTVSPTPEPSTAVLWLTGIGLMILTRKRLVQLLRSDAGTQRSLSLH